jgi:methionyl-tRNA synthetase
VQEILSRVHAAGDIYFDEYDGLYCVGCERNMNLSELVDGRCPDHQVEPKRVKEANYFFRMGKYQQRLLDHIQANPDWIRPERYRNEVLSFLKAPLEDLCISRPKSRLTWGIDLPFDDRFVTYVWFDALLNYPSALVSGPGGENLFERYWPHVNHLIAKDILKTHAIYWPTMLMGAGLPLFKQIDVHGYWQAGESKMSKSLGNVVRPLDFDRRFGIENLRYFFFREMKFGTDAGFTYELFVERYNADLANGLGNLLSRAVGLVRKSRGGAVPCAPDRIGGAGELAAAADGLPGYRRAFEERQFHVFIEQLRGLWGATDRFVNDAKPWEAARKGEWEAFDRVVTAALEVVRISAVLLSPILPVRCREILAYLGETRPLDGSVPLEELAGWGGLRPGHTLGEEIPRFPRIDPERLAAVLAEVEDEAKPAGPPAPARREDLAPQKAEITIDDFAKLDLRVGVVREAGLVEGAKKLVRLGVDLGEGRLRQVFAGIRAAYPEPAVLVGRKVLVAANLAPRQMKFGLSEGMILAGSGGSGKERLVVAGFDGDLEPGDTVS